jgi:DDE superfamily endonuclease
VQRQYTGTAGRIENSQVAVYLTDAAPRGHALIDRELYLPESWTGDPARRRAAGIPQDTQLATKPALARRMITRALDAGVIAAWAAGDEVYGADPGLREDLEECGTGYVLAVARRHQVSTGRRKYRADALAARVPARGWQRYSAGTGAKGHRYYDWALISLDNPDGQPGCRRMLIRRSLATGELAFYRCYAPGHVPHAILGQGRRPAVDHRRELPGRQGPGRPGRAPGPNLDLLAPPDHPGHPRHCVPDPGRRSRTGSQPATGPGPAHP